MTKLYLTASHKKTVDIMDVYIYDWTCKTIGIDTYYIGFGIDNNDTRVAVLDCKFHRPMYVNKWLFEKNICSYIVFLNRLDSYIALQSSLECRPLYLSKIREGYKDPSEYLCIATQNLDDYDKLRNYLSAYKVYTYETHIDPVSVFLNNLHLHRTGWFRLTKYTENIGQITTCTEYHVHYSDIRELAKHTIPAMRIMCMDIETYSTSKFKVPMAFDPSDQMRMIGTAYMYKEEVLKLAFCVDGVGHRKLHKNGITVVLCKDEYQLVDKYVQYVSDMQPEVIIGFNHLSYDYAFLVDRYFRGPRVKLTYSRLLNHPIEPLNEVWSSSAYKDNSFWVLLAPGVLDVDIIQFASREGYYKGYSLNEIASAELGEQKIDMNYGDMHDMFCTNTDEDILSIARYCLQDCVLPINICYKKQVLVGLMERARVQRISPNTVYSRGSGQQAMNQLHYECSLHGYIMDDEKIPKIKYKGATVVDPTPGIYKDCATVDFSSLYPSIIISDNICYTTYVPSSIRYSTIDVYSDIPVELSTEIATTHFADNIIEIDQNKAIVLFSFTKSRKGIIPGLLEKLIDARKDCKQMMLACTPDEYAIWNMRQYSYKIAANSIYGLLGSQNPHLALSMGAACVTARGRYHLDRTMRKLITEFGIKVIYGDTDSCFIKVKDCNSYDTYKSQCKYICNILSDSGIRLEFENAFSRLLILGKKRYVAIKYDGTEYYRGVVSVRKNSSAILKEMYNDLVRVIMYAEHKNEGVAYVQMTLHAIVNGYIDPKNLKIAVTINDSVIAKQNESLLKHMDSVGIPHMPNEKIYYIYTCDGDGPTHTSHRRQYDWAMKNNAAIDYMMHIEHELMGEIDKLLEVVDLPRVIHQYINLKSLRVQT